MYRKIVWCYIIVLALLDISLNTKLSAQGKSHGNGVSVHESLMEGISLQEWGKEVGAGAGRGGRAAPADALALAPAALEFGAAALAAAHHRTVTVTNCGNDTIHLASVAGTTPDFHASFFESKTLVPQANTTFSVVYLGRREGPVSTHLFIHTSRGLLRYPVSAEGVASSWRVWPLVGLRVPLNATLDPMLTLYNPTDTTIQVTEVYSSGTWVQLELPAGGSSAPRQLWSLPPHTARDLVRLRLHHHHPPHAAYIRIKGNMTGGGLVVGVEATCAPPGEYLRPLQLRLRTHGARDTPHTWTLEAGNSGAAGVQLEGEVWGARCGASPPDPPPPPPPSPADDPSPRHTANGGRADSGVHLTMLREHLDAHQEPVPVAHLTLDYGALWAGAETDAVYCAGWARVGRAAAPYSLRLRRGTLALTPRELHFVTASGEEALKTQEVTAHNEFDVPIHIEHIEFPPEVELYFHTESLGPLVMASGSRATVARLRLRSAAAASIQARITLRTNLTDYTLPLLLYDGTLHTEWEWAGGSSTGALALGAVSALSTRVVTLRLHNRGAAPLCVTSLRAELPGVGAQLALPDHATCVPPHHHSTATLTVVAGSGLGAVAGQVRVHTAHAAAAVPVSLRVLAGRLRAAHVALRGAAPYVRAEAPLLLDNTMELAMTVTHVDRLDDPALTYVLPEEDIGRVVLGGRSAVGRLVYLAERACQPRCATGLDLSSPDGAAWLQRAKLPPEDALPQDAALLAARKAAFVAARSNITAMLHTTEVVGVPISGTVTGAWPVLTVSVGGARLAAVGGVGVARVRLRNPASTPLALQAMLAGDIGGGECPSPACRPDAFTLGEWRVTTGAAKPWQEHPDIMVLQPGAEVELTVSFTPTAAAELANCLYLRNNLTILESVPLSGRGAHPSFELGGRKPNSTTPILLEVTECGADALGAAARSLVVRNTGAVAVRVRGWTLAGAPCAARGFRLAPCQPFTLAPNDSRVVELAFSGDWTRARAHAQLSARLATTRLDWSLLAVTPAKLIARCSTQVARPPWEPALRAVGDVISVVGLVLVITLAVLDAERALRRHRSARAAPAHRAPLDLRALALPQPAPHPAPAAPPAPPPLQPRRRRTPRRRAGGVEVAAERLAFERWRAEVSRRAPPSSEEGEEGGEAPPPAPPPPAPLPRGDASSSEPESSPSAPRKPPAQRRRPNNEHHSHNSSASDSSERSEHEHSEHSERSEADDGAPGSGAAPSPPAERREGSAPPDSAGDRVHTPPHHSHTADTAPARENCASSSRAGAEGRVRTRSGGARSGSRKERVARRRTRAASPPRARAAEQAGPPALRWGASWSSVVSRGAAPEPPRAPPPAPAAPLAPIGSDVPRRSDHSLFYYGSRAPPPAAPPAPLAPLAPLPAPLPTPHADYTGGEETSCGFRSLESVWGASMEPPAAAWLWGAPPPAVRPPPGFAPRDYDPFHSLASIWTPAALDWRSQAHDEPRDSAPASDRPRE